MKRVLFTVGILIIVLVGAGILLMYTGVYDVAATTRESPITRFLFSTTMDRSVRVRAKDIVVPSVDDSVTFTIGFSHYQEMCVTCHGSPAEGRDEAGQGLNPPAPDLSEAATDWSPSELYWIVKNGVRMTGMPAFGPTHDEKELWAIVAFVQKLPGMSPEEYRSVAGSQRNESESATDETHHHDDHPHN